MDISITWGRTSLVVQRLTSGSQWRGPGSIPSQEIRVCMLQLSISHASTETQSCRSADLQGIFPTQGSNLDLSHQQMDSLLLSRLGSPGHFKREGGRKPLVIQIEAGVFSVDQRPQNMNSTPPPAPPRGWVLFSDILGGFLKPEEKPCHTQGEAQRMILTGLYLINL